MPIAFLLKLAGAAESLWRLLRSAAAWVFSDLRHVAIAVLLTGCAYWYFNASGLKAENTGLRETLAKVEAASKEAERLAWEAKRKIEADNERKADEARDLEKKLRSDYDSRLAGWLQNNRRATGKAYLSCPAPSAEGIVGESAAADIPATHAIVPIADLELSAQAFAKLEAWQQWFRSLTPSPKQQQPQQTGP